MGKKLGGDGREEGNWRGERRRWSERREKKVSGKWRERGRWRGVKGKRVERGEALRGEGREGGGWRGERRRRNTDSSSAAWANGGFNSSFSANGEAHRRYYRIFPPPRYNGNSTYPKALRSTISQTS